MTTLNYNPDTHKVEIRSTIQLTDRHVKFLGMFRSDAKHDRTRYPIDELITDKLDDDDWKGRQELVFDLNAAGLLGYSFDHHTGKQIVQLTDAGRILLQKLK